MSKKTDKESTKKISNKKSGKRKKYSSSPKPRKRNRILKGKKYKVIS